MVSGKYKSSSFRKVFVKTPGGNTVVHRRLKKPGRAQCAETGVYLSGVKNMRPKKFANLPKSQKRPNRAYGGVLSSKPARRTIIKKARS